MEAVSRGALSGIGNTPLVELARVVPPGSARVMVKLEFANPTGSMKDRMARSAIEGAASDGRLQPGDTVVEYTAGTTGVSLAFVCAALGYGLHIVFSDAFSREKFLTMRAFGAVVEEIPSDGGQINEALIKSMIARAGELACEPGRWWCDQLNNHDAIRGYAALGDEIWLQTGGRIDAFVQSVGTAHSIHGAAEAIRAHGAELHVTAVEPAESPILSGGPTVRTESRESASGSFRRCGSPTRSTRSRWSARVTPSPWPDGSRAKRACSLGCRQVPMS